MESSPLQWRVIWEDWTNHHDWVGRMPQRRGSPLKLHRKKPPPQQSREFDTREEAERFVAELRRVYGPEEIAAQIVSLRELLPPKPEQPKLSGADWPLQRRPD
jgi:hypothetical protein